MKNWQNSKVWKEIQVILRPGDELTMPDIATGACMLKRAGRVYKVRKLTNDGEKQARELHIELIQRGWNLPKVFPLEVIDGGEFSFVEWAEGQTAREKREDFWKSEDYLYKLGRYMGKLHNEIHKGYNFSTINIWPRNILVRPDGELMYLDLNKLYLTRHPEALIEKVIIDDPISFPAREAFFKGYREFREYDFKKIIEWHIKNVFRNYHDIYLNDELLSKGSRPTKSRIEMMKLPERMDGLNVLDLGCSGGMFSLECMKKGAKYIFAVDNWEKDITHPGGVKTNHRLSDMTKLIAHYHGFHGGKLVYKHTNINTDYFIEENLPSKEKYRGKFNIAFALAIIDHLSGERVKRMFKYLNDNITDMIYYESRMGGRRENQEPRLLKHLPDFKIEYLGNASCHQKKFDYALFRCTRKGGQDGKS